MSKTRVWLIIAACLMLIGCIVFGGVMMVFNWDFTKLSTEKYQTNDYTMEDFKDISIITNTANIIFAPTENEKCSVVCFERKNEEHNVSVIDNTLTIEYKDKRKWYEHIGIAFEAPKITVYLPYNEYGKLFIKESTGKIEISKAFNFESVDITASTGKIECFASATDFFKIKTSTGDISVKDISAAALELSVSSGKITANNISCVGDFKINTSTGKTDLTDVACGSLITKGSTGDIYIKNVIAKDKFSIKRSTGDVSLDSADAAEIFIEADTGNVKGSLLSDKVFIVKTDTGKVNVPKTITGGRCEISTDTGDIKITVEKDSLN